VVLAERGAILNKLGAEVRTERAAVQEALGRLTEISSVKGSWAALTAKCASMAPTRTGGRSIA